MIGVPRSEWGSQAQWAVTAPLLAASLEGVAWALPAAVALCALSIAHYAAALRSARPYRVQVRLGFLVVCALSLVPGLAKILWVPVLGTASQVLFGVCPMARLLDLMPWNRRDALTWRSAAAAIARPPGEDGLLIGNARRAARFGSLGGLDHREERIRWQAPSPESASSSSPASARDPSAR